MNDIAKIGSIVGAASSVFSVVNGLFREKKAREAIAEIEKERIQYANNYENLRASTLGSDLLREQLMQNNATLLGGMTAGGSRAMIGAIPGMIANNANVSRQIGANLDEQQSRINFAAADYQNKIQEVYDQRQRDALIGYGTELQSSRQDTQTGLSNLAGIGIMSAGLFGKSDDEDPYNNQNPNNDENTEGTGQ